MSTQTGAFTTVPQCAPVERAKSTVGSSGTADLRQLHDEFITEQRYATRLATATLNAYRTSFDLFVSLLPNVGPAQLTPTTITEFFRRLDERLRRVGRSERHGVMASTIASHRSRLGRFFSWLKRRGVIASSPFDGLPCPRVEYVGRQYLSRGQVDRIFSALVLTASTRARFHRTRNIALFSTLLYTGIRRGELLGLRLSDFNLERMEFVVRGETSKSRRRRVLPINSALRRSLEDYLAERRKLPLHSEQLFVSDGGHALSLDGLKHLVRAVARRSGVRFHLHQFRHTFAVNFLHRGGDVAKLRQLLGHADIRMTSGYLRALPTAAMRDNVERVTLDALL